MGTCYAVAWAPFVALLWVFVPRFEPLFDHLRTSGELPAVSDWLVRLASLNKALFGFPSLLAFALLLVADAALAGASQRSRLAESLYWVWFAAVIVTGILAVVLVPVVLWLPVYMMSTTL